MEKGFLHIIEAIGERAFKPLICLLLLGIVCLEAGKFALKQEGTPLPPICREIESAELKDNVLTLTWYEGRSNYNMVFFRDQEHEIITDLSPKKKPWAEISRELDFVFGNEKYTTVKLHVSKTEDVKIASRINRNPH